MSVLGPGAVCCEQSDCDVECGFKAAVTKPAPAPTTDAPVDSKSTDSTPAA